MSTFYVATTGNDGNAGTIGSPKLTISAGVALASAGDTVYIRSGTYTGSINMIVSSATTVNGGTSYSNAITIAAYPAETVILQPGGGIGGEAIQLLSSTQQYIIFDRLILDGTSMAATNAGGFYHAGGSHHIRFQNGEIRNFSGNGVHASGASFLWLRNNHIFNNGGAYEQHTHNIYLKTSDNLIELNELNGSANNGIVLYDATTEPSRNIIRNNSIHDNAWYSEADATISGGSDNEFYNNLVYGSGPGSGLFIGFATPTNTRVYNNTFVHDGGIYVHTDASGTLITNNIVRNAANSGAGPITDTGTGTVQTTNLNSNPSFVNAASFNFHLQSGSAAIDAGTTLAGVPDDYSGGARPAGAAYDIGAYEYASVESDPPPSAGSQVHVWGSGNLSTAATGNNFICGRNSASSQTIAQPICVPLTMRNWYLTIATAPGAGQSRTYTIEKNGSLTALAITISGTATTGSSLGVDVHFAAGDVTRIIMSESGSAVAGGVHRYAIEIEPDVLGTYIYGYATAFDSPTYLNPFGGGDEAWVVFDFEYASTMGLPGTITTLTHRERTAPGVGNSRIFTLVKNGVSQDGTGGTVDTRCIIADTNTQTTAAFALSVVAGDSVGLFKASTGTPAASSWQVGTVAFVPTSPSQYNFHTTLAGMASPGPEFGGIGQAGSGNDWVTPESTRDLYGHGTVTLFFETLRLELRTAPGAGTSRTVTLYKNGSATALFATVANTATIAVATISPPIEITGADLFSLAATSAGSPDILSSEARVALGYGTTSYEDPTVETLTATNVRSASATLRGRIDPNGTAMAGRFRWWICAESPPTYHETDPQDVGSGNQPVTFTETITGLTTDTTYCYIALGDDGGSPDLEGIERSFTTSGEAEFIDGTVSHPLTWIEMYVDDGDV